MVLNEQMVKLWIKDQISKISKKEEMGLIPSDIADAKIETLRDFYETFNLDQVTTKVIYHAKV
jgi:hypothetical protein